jgi:hypothetical protein
VRSDEPEQDVPLEDEHAKKDLRFTEHQDFGVHVQRDMSGSSMFLARGSKTHYSKIQFSSQGVPRDDSSVVAGGETIAGQGAAVCQQAATAAPDAGKAPESPAEPSHEGLLGKLRSFLGV